VSLPGAYLQSLFRLFDANGLPAASYKLKFYQAGSVTVLKDTFTAADLLTANTNPVILNAEGRPNNATGAIFLADGGYDVYVYDSANVLKYTVPGVEDVGLTYLQNLGVNLTAGSRDVTSGYTILPTDVFVTVNSTGGPNPCIINLGAVSLRKLPLTIKNRGTVPIAVTPNGSDAIDYNAGGAAYTIPAAAAPTFPSLDLLPDGISTMFIRASHGVT